MTTISATYIDHMGSDLTVVNAARVSFAKRADQFREQDGKLLAYLARHQHWTPFAHPQITMHVKAPIFVRTQCFKHKVGFVENEISRRYVDDEPTFYDPGNWRARPTDKKQGSGAGIVASPAVFLAYEAAILAAHQAYQTMIDCGVAPEQARMVLPQAAMTEWYWTGSLAAWARFCRQRGAKDAQAETGLVASSAAAVIEPLFPASWEALMSAGKPDVPTPAMKAVIERQRA